MKLSRNKIKLLVLSFIIVCHSTTPVGDPLTPAESQQKFEREMYERQGKLWQAFDSPKTFAGIAVVWLASSAAFIATIIGQSSKK